ncbi:hypothetical protein Ais01nite_74220 [Asanoa ishikariensis]|nr:hypothetical protein Ais01nite_74220 [Asanoa ishikariensis]
MSLSVVDGGEVVARHWLVPGVAQVNDREPPVAWCHARLVPGSGAVRPTVGEGIAHPGHGRDASFGGAAVAADVQDAGDRSGRTVRSWCRPVELAIEPDEVGESGAVHTRPVENA